jgi:hypothetical protein
LNRQQDLALLALCGKQNTKGLSPESDTNFVNVTSQVRRSGLPVGLSTVRPGDEVGPVAFDAGA